MNKPDLRLSRRAILGTFTFGAAAFTTPGLFAEQLARVPTARLEEGPFYPTKMPLDTDNDLLIVNDSITPAVGEITHLTGRILNAQGEPIRNAFVEIWQVDHNGIYLGSGEGRGGDRRDPNFQGYGRFLTDAQGHYYFRTIKPVPYTGRTAHVHFGISRNGQRIFTTQMFVKGNPQNDRDGVFRGIRDPRAAETVLVDFKPLKESKIGELEANFDLVLGVTAQELEDGKVQGGIGKSERGSRGGFGPGGRPRRPGGPRS